MILAYRELRLLELDILEALHPTRQLSLDVKQLSKVDVDQFYGIEIEEFPAHIAEAAMWLVDHQMNMRLSEAFGQSFVRLPLKKSANITYGNALTTDWNTIISPHKLTFMLGNPPFVGHHYQTESQKAEQQIVMADINAQGVLDYVCNWYVKAARYIRGTTIKVAFVSTNSISQGEQVGLLWQPLLNQYGIHIHFAHRTFKWTIDEKKAKGMKVAAVHAIIIGFAAYEADKKFLFEYETITSDPHRVIAKNISPYLLDAPSIVIQTRNSAISNVPKMQWGNKPTDGGHFILSPQEKKKLLEQEPEAEKFIRPYMGGGDFINGIERYCLWLKDASPNEIRNLPLVSKRVQAVRDERLKSKAASTRKYAATPTIFRQIAQPDSNYLAIPEVSSERRTYVPIAFFDKNIICSNTVQFVPNATLFHFGILTSLMHMEWMRYVCGRLKSDYRYSNTLVYNNFPWPENNNATQIKAIEEKAQDVLDIRAQFPDSTLADLYDPLTMPPSLLKAHQSLDKVVDAAYRKAPFTSERDRIEFLFSAYQRLTAPLIAKTKKGRK